MRTIRPEFENRPLSGSMSALACTGQSRLSARLSVGRFSEWIFWFLIANYIM